MNTLNVITEISRNPEVAYAKIDDDVVMYGPEDGLCYGLNEVSAMIWSLLEYKPMSLNAICEQIKQQYEVEDEQCLKDVSTFIDSMICQKFLLIKQ